MAGFINSKGQIRNFMLFHCHVERKATAATQKINYVNVLSVNK